MTRKNEIENKYFDWMYNLVCEDRYDGNNSYRKLLAYLHNVEFTYTIARDSNRASDGMDLRYRFAYDTGCACADSYLEGPCSIFEMMLALAIRCEENIMDDPSMGNRTSQWFWKMVNNLGLSSMLDNNFDIYYVEDIITAFLNREYKRDGRGGLFAVRHCKRDMRRLEIWTQMCYYLDELYG